VLIIAPSATDQRSTLYIAQRLDSQTHEFFTNAQIRQLWVGARRASPRPAGLYDIETAPLEHLEKDLASATFNDHPHRSGFDRLSTHSLNLTKAITSSSPY